MNDLDARLLDAHRACDQAMLVVLYQEAAAQAADPQARAFYLTHAHVFAMDIGHPDTNRLRAALILEGRESPLPEPRAPLR